MEHFKFNFPLLIILSVTCAQILSNGQKQNECTSLQQMGTTYPPSFDIVCVGMANDRFLLITTDYTVYDLPNLSTLEIIAEIYLIQPDSVFHKWPKVSASPQFESLHNGAMFNSFLVTDRFSSYWAFTVPGNGSAQNDQSVGLLVYDLRNDQILPGLSYDGFDDRLVIVSASRQLTLYGVKQYNGEQLQIARLQFDEDTVQQSHKLSKTEHFRSICAEDQNEEKVFLASNRTCALPVHWEVKRGFIYSDRFYLFGPNGVYIFSTSLMQQPDTPVEVTTKTYQQFIICQSQLMIILILAAVLLFLLWILLTIWIYFSCSWLFCCCCSTADPEGSSNQNSSNKDEKSKNKGNLSSRNYNKKKRKNGKRSSKKENSRNKMRDKGTNGGNSLKGSKKRSNKNQDKSTSRSKNGQTSRKKKANQSTKAQSAKANDSFAKNENIPESYDVVQLDFKI